MKSFDQPDRHGTRTSFFDLLNPHSAPAEPLKGPHAIDLEKTVLAVDLD